MPPKDDTTKRERCLLGFPMDRMGTAKPAVFLELKLLRRVLLILGGRIVSLLALGAGKRNDVSHCSLPL